MEIVIWDEAGRTYKLRTNRSLEVAAELAELAVIRKNENSLEVGRCEALAAGATSKQARWKLTADSGSATSDEPFVKSCSFRIRELLINRSLEVSDRASGCDIRQKENPTPLEVRLTRFRGLPLKFFGFWLAREFHKL
jgi:hypothetical protein